MKEFPETNWQDYLLVYSLLCFSGNLAITIVSFNELFQIAFAGYLIAKLYQNKLLLHPKLLIFSYIFLTVMVVQCVEFDFFPFITIAGFFIRVITAFAVVVLVKKFLYVYIRTMVVLAIISLFFYVLQEVGTLVGYDIIAIFHPIGSYLSDSPKRVPFFLHTYLTDSSHRNSGMFWEPGAFAGYLVIGLVFLSIIKKQLVQKEYKYYLFILSITLFTTLSTTGYIAYPFAMILHFNRNKLSVRAKFRNSLIVLSIVIPLLIFTSFFVYRNLPFLQGKIEAQFQKVEYKDHRWHLTRFGSIMLDWQYIQERPLTGWGLHSLTRFALTPSMEGLSGMGNGFSDFLAKFGLIGFTTWLFFVFSRIRQGYDRSLYRALVFCFVIMILLQGEAFLNYPLFLSLAFIAYTMKENTKPANLRADK